MSGRFYTVRELAAMFGDEDAIAELFSRPSKKRISPEMTTVPEPADLDRRRAAGLAAFERAFVERGVPLATVRPLIFMSAWPWLREEASGGR